LCGENFADIFCTQQQQKDAHLFKNI